MILVLLVQALFALTFPIGKLGLQYTGALFLTAVRMVMAGVLLFTYVFWQNKKVPRIPRADWPLFLKTSLFYIYLSFVPEFWALERMSSFKNNMMWSFTPFVSALLSYYLLNERLTKRKWAGLVIGMLGMIPILAVADISTPTQNSPISLINSPISLINSPISLILSGVEGWSEAVCSITYIGFPELAMCVAVFSTAYAWFLIKQLLDKGYSLIFINSITMLMGGVLSLLTRLAGGSIEPLYTNWWAVVGYALALVIISNVIAYSLYGYLLQSYSITFLSFTGFLCPIFGAIFGKLFFNEHLHVYYVIAFAFIMTGLILFYRDERSSS
jgi:drug/metabolite transporter (DMT)-like permease